MKLLLDTHTLVWLAEGLAQLKPASRQRIDEGVGRFGAAVSAITFWEVAMLVERGRVGLSLPLTDWRERVLAVGRISEAVVCGAIGLEAVRLPGSFHADPADRIIVATARVLGMCVATRDARILDYGAAGNVAVMAI